MNHLRGLTEALERGGSTHSLEDVLAQIRRGDAQLWETEDAVIVTEIHQTPRKKLVHFWLAAGEIDAVVELSKVVLDWAKRHGCEQATLAGRKGWIKALAHEGWSPALTLMGREV